VFSGSGWAYVDGEQKGFMEKLVGVGMQLFFLKAQNMWKVRTKKKRWRRYKEWKKIEKPNTEGRQKEEIKKSRNDEKKLNL